MLCVGVNNTRGYSGPSVAAMVYHTWSDPGTYCHIIIAYRRIDIVTCSSLHSTTFRATVVITNVVDGLRDQL